MDAADKKEEVMRLPLFRSPASSISLTRSVFATCQDARFPFWRLKSVLQAIAAHELPQFGFQFAPDFIRLTIPKTAVLGGIFYRSAFGECLNDNASS